VVFASPELCDQVCVCVRGTPCCLRFAALRKAALACEAAPVGAVLVAQAELVLDGRPRLVEFSLSRAEVDGSALVVAQPRTPNQGCFDALTGLATRGALLQRLTGALNRAERPLAVVMLDLDDFKAVNDTAGHLAGDRLLSLAAQRLLGAVRSGDFVARLGGDEFIVLLDDVRELAEVAAFVQRLMDAVGRPFVLGDQTFTVGCSVGAALSPSDGVTAEVLLAQADAAMYAAKRAGKNRFCGSPDLEQHGRNDPRAAATALRHSEPRLRLGVPSIDDAHDHLLALARGAADLALRHGGLAQHAWRDLLEELLDESRLHFEEEEAVMRKLGTPRFEAHQRAHQLYLTLVERCRTDPATSGASLVVLADELVDHIESWDSSMLEPRQPWTTTVSQHAGG
jgi:diguanylate cyclase (GGDEF)-like protein/hemerythrin-like metal-binding protein